jgi:hypothetical protein
MLFADDDGETGVREAPGGIETGRASAHHQRVDAHV